jgi:hypothetical protein
MIERAYWRTWWLAVSAGLAFLGPAIITLFSKRGDDT